MSNALNVEAPEGNYLDISTENGSIWAWYQHFLAGKGSAYLRSILCLRQEDEVETTRSSNARFFMGISLQSHWKLLLLF